MVLGEQRAQVTERKIRGWFDHTKKVLLDDGINVEEIPPENIFNFNETGFPFFIGGCTIISDIQSKHPYQHGSDSKKQVTVLGCISASGKVLKPTIIFPGARWNWHPWEEFDVDYALTPNGWINSSTFMKWLQYTFFPAVDHLQRPVVLFIDGHSSHISRDVYNFCQTHHITIYVLPSHSSHIIQPLDLVFYGSLKQEWKLAVRDYKAISRFAQVTKQTFTTVFADAWKRAYSPEKVVNAFRTSGLCPWNPDAPDYSKCEASALYASETMPSADTIIEATSQEDPDRVCSPPVTPSSPDLGTDALPPAAPSSPDLGTDVLPPAAPSSPDLGTDVLPPAAPSSPDLGTDVLPPATPSSPDLGTDVLPPAAPSSPDLGTDVLPPAAPSSPDLGTDVLPPATPSSPDLGTDVLSPATPSSPDLGTDVLRPAAPSSPDLGTDVLRPAAPSSPNLGTDVLLPPATPSSSHVGTDVLLPPATPSSAGVSTEVSASTAGSSVTPTRPASIRDESNVAFHLYPNSLTISSLAAGHLWICPISVAANLQIFQLQRLSRSTADT
ncbi:uncharacterized protein LOC118477852 [Aplysia californica]|uniref:Uncharacterized protein LOC118477852 n=1 Tax=Aplysia californica TaxID=6500 RepID=A0ABM1VUX9_APLCA|nr:uncharacterized protein LOC118477852 [Aplysia californica]